MTVYKKPEEIIVEYDAESDTYTAFYSGKEASKLYGEDSVPISICGKDPTAVKAVAEQLIDLIKEALSDTDHNYGLAFYACGYDGQAQTDFVKYYFYEYGVDVF